MSDLNFGDGSWEDARRLVQQTLQALHQTIHGNGRDGMFTTLNNFITEYRTDRAVQARYEAEKEESVRTALQQRADEIQATLEAETKKRAQHDRNIDLKISIATIVIAVFMAWLAYRDYQRKVGDAGTPPSVQYRQSAPEHGGIDPAQGH